MQGFLAAARLLPGPLRQVAEAVPEGTRRRCEELRLRRGQPPTMLAEGRERRFSDAPVTEADLRAVLEAATRSSLHAVVHELRRGYIAAEGGVRVGVCGTFIPGEEGEAGGLRAFSSIAIRVPREVPGCADGIWPALTEGGFRSLLVIAPPGAGKTTLLRELIRRLSQSGTRVCAADGRGELAGCFQGLPAFRVGPCTDVMTGMPKAEAAGVLLRAMNPEVIAMDEITDEAEAAALLAAVGCGVRLLASVHGQGPEDVRSRPACRALLDAGAFRRYAVVEMSGGLRRYRVGAFS